MVSPSGSRCGKLRRRCWHESLYCFLVADGSNRDIRTAGVLWEIHMLGLFSLLNPGRWMLYAAAIAALVAGYFVWQTHERGVGAAPYIVALAKQKAEASALLATKTAEADALTKERETFVKERNENDETNEGALNILADKLATTRLRDPYQAGCRGGGAGTPSKEAGGSPAGAADASTAGGVLSEEFDGFLKQKFKESDHINAAYASCRPALYEAVKP